MQRMQCLVLCCVIFVVSLCHHDTITRNPTISADHVFMYIDVTDKGSDQSCRKRRVAEAVEASACPNVVYLPGICFLHMFHACVKNGLSLVDELVPSLFNKNILGGFSRYFGSLSKIVNVWRERAADVMSAWDAAFGSGDLEVAKLGRRYPLAVVSGRWGSVESAEDFLLLRGRTNVTQVILAVLSKNMRADKTSEGVLAVHLD